MGHTSQISESVLIGQVTAWWCFVTVWALPSVVSDHTSVSPVRRRSTQSGLRPLRVLVSKLQARRVQVAWVQLCCAAGAAAGRCYWSCRSALDCYWRNIGRSLGFRPHRPTGLARIHSWAFAVMKSASCLAKMKRVSRECADL